MPLELDDDGPLYNLPSLNTQETSSSSSSDASEEENEEPPIRKGRGKAREYGAARAFPTKVAFDAWFLTVQNEWRKSDCYDTSTEQVDMYRCRFANRVNFKCVKMMRVSFSATDDSVVVAESVGVHTHVPVQATALTEDTKKTIRELSQTGLAPLQILRVLDQRRIEPLPKLSQVQSLVKRSSATSGTAFTDVQLRTYCEAHSVAPEDPDSPYVVGYEVVGKKQFFVVWSTGRLLERQSLSKLLQCDSTYSTNWHNFPLQIVGYSDLNRHFVPTAACLSFAEDTYAYASLFSTLRESANVVPDVVLADGAKEITKAVKDVYPEATRAMCWAHAIRCCDKRMKQEKFDVETRKTIRSDIEMLQYSRSSVEFKRLADLMIHEWPVGTEDFADYFRQQWVDSDTSEWYEGATPFVSTNNGLEAVNRLVKDSHTVRQLLPFNKFLSVMQRMVTEWSTIRLREIPMEVAIPPHVYVNAYQLMASGRFWRRVRGEERYLIAGKDTIGTGDELREAYEQSTSRFNSFADYKDARFLVHVVTRTSQTSFTCTCRSGAKKRPCHHAAMLLCHPELGGREYPPDAKAERLEQRRKRGRPTQATPPPHRNPLAPKQNRFAVAQ